ncbi:MAG: LacI family DNA-binding transcriptional regulator [Pseudomonadota bacterium]
MTDVANAAGVSQSTVSMIINNVSGSRVARATRSRVLAKALELGYQLPQRDIVQTKKTIGYLIDEISTSPHPVLSLDGARDAAWRHGFTLQLAVTRAIPDQEAAAIEAMQTNPGLLGWIYSTIFTRPVQAPAALLARPTVLLNCHDNARKLPSVLPGELAGGHTATEYLIAMGHTRIGFINGEPWMEAAQDRFKGYRRALASADLPFDPALVRDGDWMPGTGFDSAMALMQQGRAPTALFCANDLMALGAIEAIKQLGLKVPQDVSVIGYDDQEIARHAHPPLTTMLLPNYEMGSAAVEALIELADAASAPPRRILIKTECPLVERASVQRFHSLPT